MLQVTPKVTIEKSEARQGGAKQEIRRYKEKKKARRDKEKG